MIITDEFVFLHVPKTAGSFVAKAIVQLYEATNRPFEEYKVGRFALKDPNALSKHGFRHSLPERVKHLPILISVRNPFTHYISIYRFRWWYDHPNTMFKDEVMKARYPHYPEISFAEFLEASMDWACSPKHDAALMAKADIGRLTRDYLHYCFEDGDAMAQKLANNDSLSPLQNIHIIHTEQVNQELYDFLYKVAGHDPADLAFILDAARENVTKAGKTEKNHIAEFYTPALRKLLLQKERVVFSLFPEYELV